MKKTRAYYTIYRKADDSIVAFGTPEECAKMMGISEASIVSLVSRSRKGIGPWEAMVEHIDHNEEGEAI